MSMRYPGGFIASTPVTAGYPSGVWTQAQAIPYQAQNVWTRDQYWPYTTLLLQGNGTNGAQNNTFLDSSTNNFTITRNGNTTQGAFTPYEANGYWSNYFDGTGDYLSLGGQSAFAFGTGDFTIEFWVYLNSTTANLSDFRPASTNGVYPAIYVTGGSLRYFVDSADRITSSTNLTVGVWYHVALSRSGTSTRLFLNGVQEGSTYTDSNNYLVGANRPTIGISGFDAAGNPLNGYLSNYRVIKGTAVYTANFTPSAAPLTAITNTSLLTCQSNRFIDNSTNAFAITRNGDVSVQAFQPFPGATTYSGTVLGGSGYFDGTGDYLSVADSTAFDLPGDFTLEFWVYPTASGFGVVLGSEDSGQNGFVVFNGTNMGVYGNGASIISVSSAIVLNAWQHIAVVRSGTSLKFYLNGTERGSATNSTSFTGVAGNGFAVAATYTNTYITSGTGYFSNVRLVKSAVYTANFTPPTAPLTAITNTSLLLNFTNAGISDAAVMNDLETVGNAQVSTSVVKYGTGSMAFDGSGDYLNLPSSTQLALGSGQFTVECWIYAVATTGSERTIVRWDAAAPITTLAFNSSAKIFWYNATEGTVLTSSTTINANTWYHIALVRDGTGTGQTKLYINGVLDATGTSSLNYTTSNLLVGNNSGNAYPLNGYIDDLRITKAARYLTSFTPPPARMPGQ